MNNGKSFFRQLIALSLPIMLQNLLQNSLSFADTLMIGQLGETEIAAVGLGNQVYFLITVVMFGISTGISIFTSQFWGSKNHEGLQKAMGVGFTFGIGIAALFSAASIFIPSLILKIFVSDGSVIEIGCVYLKWVGISYIFVSISQISSVVIRSTGDSRKPMYVTFFSMVLDVVGNYILIFRCNMGVKGAAIATLFARFAEMVIILVFLFKSKVHPEPKKMFSYDGIFISNIMKTVLPVILDDGLWALGMTVYKAVYSHMGVDVLASANISNSILDLFFVIANGLGSGTAIIIGNQIGRGERDKAKSNAGKSILIAAAGGLLSGVFLCLFSSVIPEFFNISHEVKLMTAKTLVIMGLLMPIKYANHSLVTGALRSGGDTKFILIAESISVWCVGVPLVFLAGIVFQIPIQYVFLVSTCEEMMKIIICLPRVFHGKWINDVSRIK